MRVLIAARLSRSRDGQTGFDTQDQACVRWAQEHGHEVVGIAADLKTGASHLWDRKNLRPWVSEPEKIAQYDAICCHKVDRLTRADEEGVDALKAWARQHHKQILISSADVRWPSEGMEGGMWDLYIRLAHAEYLAIKDRWVSMTDAKHDAGSLVGKAPWGYDVVRHAGVKTLEPNAVGRVWIPRIFAWVAEGRTLQWVADELTAEGVEGRWYYARLAAIIRRRTYSGLRPRKGRSALDVEALVTRALQEQAIETLASTARTGATGTARPKALLAALHCGHPECAGAGAWPMYRFATVKRGKTYSYYRCSGDAIPERKRGCGAPMIREDVLDGLVMNATEYWDSRPYVYQRYVAGNDAGVRLEQLRAQMTEALENAPAEKIPAVAADFAGKIAALEAEGSVAPHWEDVDSGMTEGQRLWSLDLDGRRAYLARKDIRAWKIGERVHVLVDGALARKGGRSALADEGS